jgi:hypothetical protein
MQYWVVPLFQYSRVNLCTKAGERFPGAVDTDHNIKIKP